MLAVMGCIPKFDTSNKCQSSADCFMDERCDRVLGFCVIDDAGIEPDASSSDTGLVEDAGLRDADIGPDAIVMSDTGLPTADMGPVDAEAIDADPNDAGPIDAEPGASSDMVVDSAQSADTGMAEPIEMRSDPDE